MATTKTSNIKSSTKTKTVISEIELNKLWTYIYVEHTWSDPEFPEIAKDTFYNRENAFTAMEKVAKHLCKNDKNLEYQVRDNLTKIIVADTDTDEIAMVLVLVSLDLPKVLPFTIPGPTIC